MVKLSPTAPISRPSRIAEQVGVKKRRVPTAPTLSREELVKRQGEAVKKAQQEFIKKETTKVDTEISNYRNDIAGYNKLIQASIEKYGGKGSENRAKLNQLDDDKSFARRQIRGLQRGKQYITRGASYSDVTAYASAKASAELANIAAAKQVSYQTAEAGEIYYNPKTKIYYARDPTTGKVILTSGQRGLEFFQERMGLGKTFTISKAEQKKINIDLSKARFQEALKTYEPRKPTTTITKPMSYFKPSKEMDYFGQGTISKEFSKIYMQDDKTSIFTPTLEAQPYAGISIPYGMKDVKWWEPQFGTITTDYPMGLKEVSLIGEMKKKEEITPTFFAPTKVIYQKEAEAIGSSIIKDLLPKYQGKVDSGEMTEAEAEKKLKEEAEKKFKKKWEEVEKSEAFKNKIKRSEEFREDWTKAFSPEYRKERRLRAAEIAGDVIAIGASTIAPPVGVAWFTGKGIYKATKGAEEDIRIYDISPSGELITPLYPELKMSALSQEAGLDLLFGGLEAGTMVSKAGAAVTAARVEALATKPWTVTTKELFKVGDETWVKVAGTKGIGTASAEGKAMFPIKIGKGGEWKIMADGFGKVETRTVDFMKQGIFPAEEAIIKSKIEYGIGAGRGITSPAFIRDMGFKIIPEEKLFVTSGEGFILPRPWQEVSIKTEKVSPFWKAMGVKPGDLGYRIKGRYFEAEPSVFTFGGIAEKRGKEFKFITGKLEKARLYPGEKRFTGLFQSEVVGETLVKDIGGKEIKWITPSKSFKKTPFTKTFLPEKPTKLKVYPTKPKAEQIFEIKPSIKMEKVIREESIYAGTGRYELTTSWGTKMKEAIGKQYGGMTFKEAEKISIEALKAKTAFKPFVKTGVATATAIISKQFISPKIDTKLMEKTKVTSDVFSRTAQSITPRQRVDTKLAFKITQKLKTKQISKLAFKITPVPPFLPSRAMPPRSPVKLIPPLPKLWFGLPGLALPIGKKKQQGYIPEAKTRGGKWMALSRKPMSRGTALSRGARATDQTLSAQFRIRKMKGKVTNGLDNYFGVTRRKYRPYKIRKGKAIELHNQFIEIRGSRIDTRGEKQGLKLARFVKQQGWMKKKKKSKKKIKSKKKK